MATSLCGIFLAVFRMAVVHRDAHFLDADVIEQTQGLGGGVHKTAGPRLAGFVFDEERDLRLVSPCLAKGLDEELPHLGVVALEGEFVTVAQGTAGDLVGADGLGEVLGVLDELNGLAAGWPDPWRSGLRCGTRVPPSR